MNNNITHTNIDRAVELFKGLDVSENTRRDYAKRIDMFIRFVDENSMHTDILLEFKKKLADKALSVSSKNKYLTAAKMCLSEMYRKHMIPIDVVTNVRCFRQDRGHHVSGVNQAQIEQIESHLRNLPNGLKTDRIRAIYCLLAYQGLRQIEVTRLTVEDIDLERKTAYVRGKGRDDKELVYLHPATVGVIRSYLDYTQHKAGALFYSLGHSKQAHLSTMTINLEMRSIFRACGIQRRVHGLRHYYITTVLGVMGVREAQKLSRHRGLDMLMVYDDEVATKRLSERVFDRIGKVNFR